MNKRKYHIALKFKTRFLCGVIIIIMITTFAIGFVYYKYAYKNTNNNYNERSTNSISQVDTYLSEHILGIATNVNALNSNLSFQNTIQSYFSNKNFSSDGKELNVIADSLSQLELSDSLIDSAYLYTESGDFDDLIKIRNNNFDIMKSKEYQNFINSEDLQIGYFSSTKNYIFQTEHSVIPLIYKKKLGNNDAFYSIALNVNEIGDYLATHFSTFNKIYFISKYGNVVNVNTQDDEKIISQCENQSNDSFKITVNKKTYIVTSTTMELTGWKIYAIKTTSELVDNLNALKIAITLQLLVASGLAVILGVLFVNHLSAPITQLAKSMEQSTKNGINVKFNYDDKDELGKIATSFNLMSDEITQLVAELNQNIQELENEKINFKTEQEKKRIAEIKALQSQINPHFLYNTLNTISWQASVQGAMDVCILANLLGTFFRNSLNRGKEYATIAQEEEQVKSYLEIQKIRYINTLDFVIEIPENIKKYYTVNLVLQPLVENAIYHGVKEANRKGIIKVSGELVEKDGEKSIYLIVEDNGVGIEEEKLNWLNKQLIDGHVDSNTGYGIYNVNERIRLSYGKDYGLIIQSKIGVGTKSIISLPLIILDQSRT